jgi:hypothetical protein
MDLDEARSRLALGVDAIGGVVAGIGDEEARYRPGPEAWCVLDGLSDLKTREVDPFRARLRAALTAPGRVWLAPPPRTQGTEPRAGGPREALAAFREERAVTLAWLASLRAPDLDRTPSRQDDGLLRGGDVLAAWVAHDLLQLRRLVQLRRNWWLHHVWPYDADAARRSGGRL